MAQPNWPGRRPSPGRAGERLGDVEPLVGGRALGGQTDVVAVPALGDHEAEVQRGPGDAVSRIVRSPRPAGTGGRHQLDADRGARDRLAPVR